MKKTKGFTLIELMIVVAIIAILAAIAIPSYTEYVKKGRRVDAKDALSALQLAQEKYRGNNASYGTLDQLGLSATSTQGFYTIAITAASATAYTATATATGVQASDTACPTLTVTQAGFSGTAACWGL